MGDRLKAADLARSAGISVQQLRTYVDTGLLPPVDRTPGGHRLFTAAHADALAVARELAAGHGWATARTVMAAVHAGDLEAALAALDAGHARLDRERGELAAVREAMGTVLAGRVPPPAARRALRIGEAARAVGVKPPVLRLWEARGLLRPGREPSTGYRLYDRTELRVAQVVALLRKGHHPLAAVEAVLRELRANGSPDRVLAALDARAGDLHRRSLLRLGASAALHGYLRRLGHH
ncbi:MerR family transcriptional regulator [Streptomyces sp. TRM76323]|uniref:MerR family transcriptional regulator n=1 Tax=Streptomyces tamarix TaxID=3078565 RepID=A0ABU3QMU3_9ACTN|nr:MerR family transcriptional regulator [Streptomyces tamarix]MDT9684078.1 MerR family transcriptional regulator [Streptomyces tamarix]